MEEPDIKLNPNARMRYEIIVTIKNAPGPFDDIDGVVEYSVEDRKRVPEAPFSGAALFPQKQVPLHLKRTGDNIYIGEMYVDRLLDEDYFGKGICHWVAQGIAVDLLGQSVRFRAPAGLMDILNQKAVDRFYARSSYLDTNQRIDIGTNAASDYKVPNDTFSIEIRSREASR